ENLAKRHEIMAKATRQAVKELGLELLSESPANSATGVYAPAGINADDLRKELLKIGFRVAGGQDHLKGKIFRIAHMGYFDFMDVVQVIGGLEIALKKIGYPVELGKGVAKAQEIVMEGF
ncbi:soluble hydrogenase, 42 kDa subunit, partial [Hydrogenivirga sp. 128-5-R1-1]